MGEDSNVSLSIKSTGLFRAQQVQRLCPSYKSFGSIEEMWHIQLSCLLCLLHLAKKEIERMIYTIYRNWEVKPCCPGARIGQMAFDTLISFSCYTGQEQWIGYKNCLSYLLDVQGSWLVWWILKIGWCQLEIPKILANDMGLFLL